MAGSWVQWIDPIQCSNWDPQRMAPKKRLRPLPTEDEQKMKQNRKRHKSRRRKRMPTPSDSSDDDDSSDRRSGKLESKTSRIEDSKASEAKTMEADPYSANAPDDSSREPKPSEAKTTSADDSYYLRVGDIVLSAADGLSKDITTFKQLPLLYLRRRRDVESTIIENCLPCFGEDWTVGMFWPWVNTL